MAQLRYVSYNDIALELSTPVLQAWLDKVLPVSQFKDWCGWFYTRPELQQLPIPPLPVAPKLELGTLYWPTGAVNPAWFHAAVTDSRMKQLRAVEGTPHNLVLQDGRDGKKITASMYMLPPRPISQFGTPPPNTVGEDGWIVTFTDQRFYWHWKQGNITSQPVSWTDLFASLSIILGVTVNVDPVNTAFQFPSDKWIGYLRPPATVLDAAAAQVGQRVVCLLDGTVKTVKWDTANTAATDQFNLLDSLTAGGAISRVDIGRYVPEQVSVAFRDSTVDPGIPKIVTTTLGSLAISEYLGNVGVAGTTGLFIADYTYNGTNIALVNALAVEASKDWYGWQLADEDFVCPGIEPWVPTGQEDFIEWVAQIREDGPNQMTRVRRKPWDVFASGGLPTNTSCGPFWGRLTAYGTGIDGGTAWDGLTLKEVGGSVVDNIPIGTACGCNNTSSNRFVAYPTKAVDGSSGLPEVGDIVLFVRDPNKSCRWEFQPKKSSASGSCCDLSWLGDIQPLSCLAVAILGGDGKCSCIPVDNWATPTPMVYVNNSFINNAYLATAMKSTCCGCGLVYFRVTDPEKGLATLTLDGFHVACDDGRVFTKDLKMEGCCVNPFTGKPGVIFTAPPSVIPKTCDGTPGECGQSFKVWVGCGSCPDVICDCCCLAQTAPEWVYRISDIGGGFSDSRWNGSWGLTHDTVTGGCLWSGGCIEGGSGSGSGATYTATLEYISGSGVYRLTHDSSVYQLAIASWKCCQPNTLTRVSGSDGPSSIIITPVLPNGVCSECTPPDEITVDIDTHGSCPSADGSYVLHKVGSGTTATWHLDTGNTVGVLTVDLSCVNQVWQLQVSGQCDPMIPAPWNIDSVGLPNSQSFGPFEVIWLNQDVSMTDPSPTPDCCNHCVGCVTLDVHE